MTKLSVQELEYDSSTRYKRYKSFQIIIFKGWIRISTRSNTKEGVVEHLCWLKQNYFVDSVEVHHEEMWGYRCANSTKKFIKPISAVRSSSVSRALTCYSLPSRTVKSHSLRWYDTSLSSCQLMKWPNGRNRSKNKKVLWNWHTYITLYFLMQNCIIFLLTFRGGF